MASILPHHRLSTRRARLLACSAACLLLVGGIAGAQQIGELRGPVAEEDDIDDRSGERVRYRPEPTVQAEPVSELDEPDEPIGSTVESDTEEPASPSIEDAEEVDVTEAANEPASTLDSLDEDRNTRARRDNVRTGAIEGLGRQREENPYAPLGIRAGSFLLTPTLEQGMTWTSNASAAPGGSEALLSETGLRLNAISDWSRHSLSIQADGTFRKTISGEEIEELEGGANADLLLDLGAGFEAQAGLGYRARPESASSPVTIEGVASRPLRQTLTGSAGIARDIGRLRLGVTGDVERDLYGDAELSDGSILSQDGRNTTLATVALRAGYEISPALRPFVEGEIGRRLYDEEVDALGYARSADRYALRAGLELDLGEKLTGEFSAGWLTERPDDERLDAISAPTIAANVTWSPLRGTVVELNGTTTVESTSQSDSSGSLLYAGSLAVTREMRANLTGRALIGLDWRDYAGSSENEMILRGEASLTWWLNRYAGVTARARHEIQRSSLADRDYDATSIYLGMTLQR
ncbi:outer membrane beta-barrel protein [Mesorhizobium sp. CAU 1741]|uniref:outer membrane beta-barrel protein n=1 Tax=Mesorhizobium sp. CAU 1741 TaxID=3140366 RepID=UPI00325BE387